MGKRWAEQQVVVAGPPQACFEALSDYESFPQWQRAVKEVRVLSRDRRGRGQHVAFRVDAKVRTISYELRYSYEPPHRIAWEYVRGDLGDIDGEYILEDRGDGTTLATYSVGLDPGVWVPGPIFKLLNDQVMRGSIDDLKRRVEDG